MYEKALVSFIDILGFKELVENSKPEKVKIALDFVKKFAESDDNEEDADLITICESLSFSDCIVRVRRVGREPNISSPGGSVLWEIMDLLIAQAELVNKNILLRGGIAYGDIYFNKNQIFGPALNQAYELESKYAVFPRIILSPNLIKEIHRNKLLKRAGHSFKEEIGYIKEMLKLSDEGFWFINYIEAIENNLDYPELYPKFLLRHKVIICEGANKFKKMNTVLIKYLWLASYHNNFIKKIPDKFFKYYKITKTKFLISSKELESLQSFKS